MVGDGMGRYSYFVTACLAGVLLISGGDKLGLPAAAMAAHADATTAPPFSVAAYLPEWRYEGADFDTMAQTLTHLILFSLEPTAKGKITSRDRLPRPLLLKDAREATRKHGCRLLVCFGGNGRSGGFRGMVRSKKARKRSEPPPKASDRRCISRVCSPTLETRLLPVSLFIV